MMRKLLIALGYIAPTHWMYEWERPIWLARRDMLGLGLPPRLPDGRVKT